MWFATLWMYLVPFDASTQFWTEPFFWVGLLFVTFPLNFMAYGLNDFTDGRADSFNPRKGNFIFGSRLSRAELEPIPKYIFVVMVPFLFYFSYVGGTELFILLLFMIVVKIINNYKPFRIKERPPFEIFMQAGYVFTALFSILLNDLPMLPWQTFLYLIVFAYLAQIAAEIMDIDPDREAKKKSTAVLIGRKNSKLLLLFLILFEAYILKFWFDDVVLSLTMGLFALWMIIDLFFVFKDKPYSVSQMKAFGVLANVAALLSIIWVLYSGTLLHPNF